MKLSELEKSNRETLAWLRGKPTDLREAPAHRYHGFYDVDIFECPPFVMFTADDCPRAGDILYAGSFEPQSMKLWCRLAALATGILDIGAHVGVYSLAAAALRPDLTVFAFEPNPYAFARLRLHKYINELMNIEEHTVALGHKTDVVEFGWVKRDRPLIASGAGVIDARPPLDAEYTIARMVRLDDLGIVNRVGARPLIKIDVEGSEYRVFKGMRDLLPLKPDIILESFDSGMCEGINDLILPLGYKVFHILEAEGRIVQRDRIEPASPSAGGYYNQFLTARDVGSVLALAS